MALYRRLSQQLREGGTERTEARERRALYFVGISITVRSSTLGLAGNARVHNTGRRGFSDASDRAHHTRLEVAEDFRQTLGPQADCRLDLRQA